MRRLVLGALGALASGLAAQELLLNPGFEDGGQAASPWSENVWGEPRPAYALEAGSVPHGGLSAQRVAVRALPERSGFIYRQPFTFRCGRTYRGRVWLRSPDQVRVQVLLRRSGPHYEPCAARALEVGPAWQEVTVTGGFGGGEAVPGFFGVSFLTPGTLELDDASLADISEEVLQRPTPQEPLTRTFFGVHINKLGSHNVWPALGQGTLRLWDTGTTWSQLEPRPGEWAWTRLDYYVRHALKHDPQGRLILTLGIPPAWACDPQARKAYNGCAAPPLDLELWRRYVRTVGERYRGKILFWEPWNECDYGGFFNGGPSAMLPLARVAYEELKAIDPQNRVLSPNVTRAGFGWLDAYLAAGGGRYCDIVSFHRYPGGTPENDVPEYAAVAEVARAHGLGDKPIWNTEGAIEHRTSDGEAAVGAVARAWLVQWAQGITAFCWYAWDIHWESGTPLGTSLTGPELAPAGHALAELVRWTEGAVMTRREVSGNVWLLALRRGETPFWIAWRTEGTAAWTVPAAFGPVSARTLAGPPAECVEGALTLGPVPVLLQPAASPR